MNNLNHTAQRKALSLAIDVLLKKLNKEEREEELLKIVNLFEKYKNFIPTKVNFEKIKNAITQDGFMKSYINRVLDEVDPNVIKTMTLNFGFEALLCGTKKIRESREKYKCNIPWLILMDPTSACNLHCVGCWAAEYGYKLNLTYDEMDDIVTQGEKLGVNFYLFTGGEPLVRKDDLIRLAKSHSQCAFLAFTNGTLVDEKFCRELKEVGNFALAISLEGYEEVNDMRRGEGVYKKVMHAMDLLKENGLIFGTSICYTSKNYNAVTDPEFVKLMVDKGCKYALYFHYMPVGNDASVELLPTPEQRIYVKNRIRKIRSLDSGEGLFTMDFQNDGEFVGGCIAGGRNYFHINANGDAEPCVFIHYSNTNIRTHSLIEILQSPLFMAYYKNQPFNSNHLRPCPMLENPEILQRLVNETNAKSTDLISPETAKHLCDKCNSYAEAWKPYADKIWAEEPHFMPKSQNYKK